MGKSTIEEMSEISEFFEGRSVLITGACGYLGTILLEHLLRLCPGIVEIFILVREKNGSTPIERKERLLNKPPFWKIKKDSPEALEKVHVVSGELRKDDVGVSPEDLEKLKNNVSVIFHCAASISFKRDMCYMLMNNVVGTYNVICLCKKLPKITAFLYTSSAFSNSHLKVIKEEILHFLVPIHEIIAATRLGDEKFIKDLEKNHGKKWGNRYLFSKSLAENLIVQEVLDIPTAIVRPSIISLVWKGSLPGYIEAGTYFADGIYSVATGLTRVILLNENKRSETIPPDIVANTLIATALNIAKKRVDSPLVLNCISSNTVTVNWGQMFKELANHSYSVFCPNTFRTPKITYIHSAPQYLLMSFIYQHIPAYFVDTAVALYGGNIRLVEIYKKIDQGVLQLWSMGAQELCFESANFENLKSLLNKRDREIFHIDLTDYNFQYIAENISVNDAYRFRTEDIKSKLNQAAIAERLASYTEIYESFLMVILFTFVWFSLKLIFHNII